MRLLVEVSLDQLRQPRLLDADRQPAISSPVMSDQPERPIQVNRAPVLALWATVVAEALGHPPDTAVTLGRYVTSSSARIKARSIGVMDEAQEATERLAR